jgi:integrase
MAGRVFLRNKTYWISFSYKGKEFRKSALTDKKREAERILAHYLSLCARGEFAGFGEARETLTVGELFDDLIADAKQRQLRDVSTMEHRVKSMRKAWGTSEAARLTERQIDLYVKERLTAGAFPATVNCEMQYLSQAFKLTRRKKLMAASPHIARLKVQNARQGFFRREDVERVIAGLPAYLQDFVWFAYLTGWRKNEIASLEWRDIEGTIHLRPEMSKTAEGRVLTLVGELHAIVERRRAARKELIPLVFHRDGWRINNFYAHWQRACAAAGLPDRLFHDLRRTAVRNMTRAGVPRPIARQISGHKTDSVYERYDIVDEEDIRNGLLKMQHYIAQNEKTVIPLRETRTGDAQQKSAEP